MKAPLVVITLIVVGMLGLLIVYSQTGLPQKGAAHEAVAAAYGGGSVVRGVDYGTIAVLIAFVVAVLLSGHIRNAIVKKK